MTAAQVALATDAPRLPAWRARLSPLANRLGLELGAFAVFLIGSLVIWMSDLPPNQPPVAAATLLWLCVAGGGFPTLMFVVAKRLTARFPIGRRTTVGGSIAHVLALGAILGVYAADLWLLKGQSPIPLTPQPPLEMAVFGIGGAYLFLLFACQGARAALYYRSTEAARLRLRAEVIETGRRRAEAQLRVLKSELNPHFIGNALQSVKTLLRTNVSAADSILAPLGALLRSAITRAHTAESTLAEELEALEPFLEVERAKLQGRLRVTMKIDHDALNAFVPDTVLQPLVENAVKHGLLPSGGGRIHVAARRVEGDALELVVENDGAAAAAPGTSSATVSGGVGLANVRARLMELYGVSASLELGRGGIGTRARIVLPWREAEMSAAELPAEETAAAPASAARRTAASATRITLTVAIWFWWAAVNTKVNAIFADIKGFEGVRGYNIADGLVVATVFTMALLASITIAGRLSWRRLDPKHGASLFRIAGVHILGAVVFAVTILATKYLVVILYHHSYFLQPERLKQNIPAVIASCVLDYLLFAFGAHFYQAVRHFTRSDAARLRLRAELETTRRQRAETELRALKAQLNPHFIGNALHAVSSLMRSNVSAAEQLVDQLADLLRGAVARAGTQEVSLREELETLEPFLAVERIRLGRTLDVRAQIDAGLLDARVPHMILQPLVENAVQHGLAPRHAAGCIVISARRTNGCLELLIRDDGIGFRPGATTPRRTPGIGLSNTRARLVELYGAEATLDLTPAVAGGTVARVTIPLGVN